MQNKTWIWVVVALVVVGLGVFLFLGGGAKGIATLGNTSLRELLTSSQPQKCEFKNSDSDGTLYVGAGKIRGDFTSNSGDTATKSHMVISNDQVYVWIDGNAQGYRLPFESLNASSSGSSVNAVDADSKVATKCENWQASEDKFMLPTDVTFNTVPTGAPTQTNTNTGAQSTSSANGASGGATVKTGNPNMSYHEQQCAACDMIKEAGPQAQCKASFDCE